MTKRILSNLFFGGAVSLFIFFVIGSVGAFEIGNISFVQMLVQMIIGCFASYGCYVMGGVISER